MSDGYTRINIDAVEDLAPKYGMAFGEARMLSVPMRGDEIGMAHYRMQPGKRLGFGHRHREAEEAYVVLEGTGRAKLGDDVIDLATLDVIHVPPATLREFEAGPDGMVLLATGRRVKGDAEMVKDFWTD